MKYVSTRDPERKEYSYGDVLLEGIAPDGGLYVPTYIPVFDIEQIKQLAQMAYEELFVAVRGHFVGGDISERIQLRLAERAYDSTKFPYRSRRIVTAVTQIDRVRFIQDLSGGPTGAFKDLALQAVGQDMQHELDRRDERLVIVGASSGDTISSAGDAVLGNMAMELVMLLPENGPTEFQRAQSRIQMGGTNVNHILYPGSFDECQDMVKLINKDSEFSRLGAMNSINWARIASQVPYYFSGYFQVVGDNIGEEVDFVVPTGNFGNVLAGYIAKKMGLPIRKLVIATNENSVLEPLVNGGDYCLPDEILPTTSPSMDIGKASNYERLFYWLSGNDANVTARYMRTVERLGRVKLADFAVRNSALLDEGFCAAVSTHQNRIDRIRELYRRPGKILVDPHTADAVQVSTMYPRDEEKGAKHDNTKTICMSTAKPVKFEDTIREALGFVPRRTDERFIGLEDRAKKGAGFILCDNIHEVKDFIRTRI